MNISKCKVRIGEEHFNIFNNNPLSTNAVKWWHSNIESNGEWKWGYLNFEVSNRDIFALKVEQNSAN